eukprot:11843974-Ditylum_brightwellii.AAC.1
MMGAIVWKLWEKRCKHIRSDYAVTGWILSPLPWVMEDCKENNKGSHQLAVEWVVDKLYDGNLANAIGKAKNDF